MRKFHGRTLVYIVKCAAAAVADIGLLMFLFLSSVPVHAVYPPALQLHNLIRTAISCS